MSQYNHGRVDKNNSKSSRRLNHSQKKVAERQRLETVYKGKTNNFYSDDSVQKSSKSASKLSSHRTERPTSKRAIEEKQVLFSYSTGGNDSSVTLQEQYIDQENCHQQEQQQQQQQQQQLVYYIQKDQNTYQSTPIENLHQFYLDQLVVGEQDSGIGTLSAGMSNSQTGEEMALYNNQLYNTNETDGHSTVNETPHTYQLSIDRSTGADTTTYNMEQLQQQEQQQMQYSLSPPRTQPKRSSSTEKIFKSPNSPKSFASPMTPKSISPATAIAFEDNTNNLTTSSPRLNTLGSHIPFVPVASKSINNTTQEPISHAEVACKKNNNRSGTPVSRPCSPYVPPPGKNSLPASVSYVPTPRGESATSGSTTQQGKSPNPYSLNAVPSTSTSTSHVAPSRGKKISMNDTEHAVPNTDMDSDTDAEGDNNDNDNDKREISTEQIFEIFEEVSGVADRDDVIEDLNSFRDLASENGDDLFSITERKLRLLVRVGKYIDHNKNTTLFRQGFRVLFERGAPDLKTRWEQLRQTAGYMDTVRERIPTEFQWLFIHLAMCYISINSGRNDFLVYAASSLRKAKAGGTPPLMILRLAVGLNTLMKTKRKHARRDEITESDMEPPSPSPNKKSKKKHPANFYENDEDSDTASVVSFASTRRNPNTRMSVADNRLCYQMSLDPRENSTGLIVPMGIEGIRYRPTNRPINLQGIVCVASPNNHLSSAMKSVVSHTMENKDRDIEFDTLVEVFVKKVTESVFGETMSDLSKICMKNQTITDEREKEAISYCTNLRSLVLTSTQINFTAVEDWSEVYCTNLKRVLSATSGKIGECNSETLKAHLKEEYPNIVNSLRNGMKDSFQKYTNAFKTLARISDWCTYAVFGVSLIDKSDTVDMSVLIKNVILAWCILGKCPLDLSKTDNDKLQKINWCVPLAYLLNLNGFRVHAERTEEPSACPLDRFIYDI